MMGELRVRVLVLCRESCEVPKVRRSAAQRRLRAWVCVGERSAHQQPAAVHRYLAAAAAAFCGTRSWHGCALPGQEGHGPGPGTCLALFLVSG